MKIISREIIVNKIFLGNVLCNVLFDDCQRDGN